MMTAQLRIGWSDGGLSTVLPGLLDAVHRLIGQLDQRFTFGCVLGVAADAYAHFGKGRHPAALNMGDCFAYACAKANKAKLLFKGNDFSKTDIDVA